MQLAVLLLSAFVAAPADTISVGSLLPQMIDMSYLTHRPKPFFKMAQSSSYDRRSNPGPNSDPFANGDAGNFLRVEKTSNGNEYVMADLIGPGAVVRVWSANPAGTIRFYFDGESKPRLEAPMADLLQGRVAPWTDPFAYNAANGTNLYFPFPYAKSLKITADESGGGGVKSLYYHVGYRTYEPGTEMRTFSPNLSRQEIRQMSVVSQALRYPISLVQSRAGISGVLRNDRGNITSLTGQTEGLVKPGSTWRFERIGPGTVRELWLKIPFPLVQNIRAMDWGDSFQPHNVLRTLLMSVEVDGKPVVNTPVGDFFGTSPGLNPYKTYPFEVRSDGTMICRLPMPFQNRITFRIENTGKVEVPFYFDVIRDTKPIPKGTYALHAEWSVDKGSTRPFRDMSFLNTSGEGMWVGSNMHISNPSPGWWGEGDEKVYVDGETFPSTFGTGTEDYYGYAWSAPIVFQRPYHAQPRSDGPANFGHSVVERWHILDPIPFTKAFRFDLEMWHWAEVDANYTHTAFWYAPAGSHAPIPIDRSLLLPMELAPPKPVKGALEGEDLPVVEKTGGVIEQQGGFWELSSGKQLWWRDVNVGDKLTLTFPVSDSGRYELLGNFCFAHDYGIHKLLLDGKQVAERDFYGTGVSWKKISLGTFDLTAGEHRLTVVCSGNRAEALPARMFGLDYLLLTKQ